jgi:DNA-directed RNA polymerase subunit RPC12/RpoP
MDLAVRFNSLLAKSDRFIAGVRSTIARTLSGRVRRRRGISIFLYACGGAAAITGCVIFIPAISLAVRLGDPVALLGAPIIMNGVLLFLFGVLLFAVGEIIELLSRISSSSGLLDSEPVDAKIVIRCPTCSQQLRMDGDRKGTVRCPRCSSKFQVEDATL